MLVMLEVNEFDLPVMTAKSHIAMRDCIEL